MTPPAPAPSFSASYPLAGPINVLSRAPPPPRAPVYCRPSHSPFVSVGLCLLLGFTYMFDTPGVERGAYVLDKGCDASALYRSSGASLRCLFVHANAEHAIGNILSLLSLSVIVEILHGHARTATVFLYGGIFGSLGWAATSPSSLGGRARLAGASSGVYSVAGAYVAHLLLNWSETPFKVPFAVTLLLLICLDVYLFLHHRVENVAYAAHGFGFLVGSLLSVCLLRNWVRKRWEAWLLRLSSVLLLAGCSMLLAGSVC